MSLIKIEIVTTKSQEKDFIKVPWSIYRDDQCWVPPLISDFKKSIRGENNMLSKSGPFTLIVAYKNDIPCGRLCVGINEHLNEAKKYKEGYISLFECIADKEVADKLLSFAEEWLKKKNMERIIGPLSLPGGDDNRGFIIDNFDDPTLVMNTYNKEYYNDYFTDYGFRKYLDCYAYKVNISEGINERYQNLVPYAMEKYKFKLNKLDLNNIDKEMMDIKSIIEQAMPEEWDDFIPPSEEEIKIIAEQLIPVADPDLIYIARTNEGKPIGFNLTVPDYNQVLKHMNGRVFPTGFLKYILNKKKINRARFFVLFVVPEYRKKGVSSAIYLNSFKSVLDKGYEYAEGSTIWEYNDIMMRDIERFGGKKYKTYRIYKKVIG